MSGRPSPDDLRALRTAYDAYWSANLGELNATAEGLKAAAIRCGYEWGVRAPGVLPWVLDTLGLPRPPE